MERSGLATRRGQSRAPWLHGRVELTIFRSEDEGNTPLGVELSGHRHIESIERQGVQRAAGGKVQIPVVHPVIGDQERSPAPQD